MFAATLITPGAKQQVSGVGLMFLSDTRTSHTSFVHQAGRSTVSGDVTALIEPSRSNL
jgi:hypothetical protein